MENQQYLNLVAAINTLEAGYWEWLMVKIFGEKIQAQDSNGTPLIQKVYKGKVYLVEFTH